MWFWHQWSAGRLHSQNQRCGLQALHGGTQNKTRKFGNWLLSAEIFIIVFLFFFAPLCVSAWKDRPQRFQTRLRRPFRRVESWNHPGKPASPLPPPPSRPSSRVRVWIESAPWWGEVPSVCCASAFSMSWRQGGFLTRSGIACSTSWRRWWKVNLRNLATRRRGSSPPSSSTLSTYGEDSCNRSTCALTAF